MTTNAINLSRYSDLCFEYTFDDASGERTLRCESLNNNTTSRYIIFQGYKSTNGTSHDMLWGTTNITSTYATPTSPGYDFYRKEGSAFTFYIHSVYLVPKPAQTKTVVWDAIASKKAVTASQATATYSGNTLTGSISGTAVELAAPRILFSDKITSSGTLHIKGTINLSTSSTISSDNAGISVNIGTTSNTQDVLYGYALYGGMTKGQNVPFELDLPISQSNTYLTFGFGRRSQSVSGGSYYASYSISELYVYY